MEPMDVDKGKLQDGGAADLKADGVEPMTVDKD